MRHFFGMSCLLLAAAFVVSCQESVDESDHYKVPDWLKGHAYEVLQK